MVRKYALNDLIKNADGTAALLATLANRHRLLTLCQLMEEDMCVGELAQVVGINQSNMSWHLNTLNAASIVNSRREARNIYYSISSPDVELILSTLSRCYLGQKRPSD